MTGSTSNLYARFERHDRRIVTEVAAHDCVLRHDGERWVLRVPHADGTDATQRPRRSSEVLRAVSAVVEVAGARAAGYLSITDADGVTVACPPHRWPVFEVDPDTGAGAGAGAEEATTPLGQRFAR